MSDGTEKFLEEINTGSDEKVTITSAIYQSAVRHYLHLDKSYLHLSIGYGTLCAAYTGAMLSGHQIEGDMQKVAISTGLFIVYMFVILFILRLRAIVNRLKARIRKIDVKYDFDDLEKDIFPIRTSTSVMVVLTILTASAITSTFGFLSFMTDKGL